MVFWDPRGSREKEAPVYSIGERWMVRNPSAEVKGCVRISASFFYSLSNHTHPPRKVGWGKLEDIKHDGFLVTSGYIEVEFGENGQSVGSQGLAALVDKTGVVSHLRSHENTCRQNG